MPENGRPHPWTTQNRSASIMRWQDPHNGKINDIFQSGDGIEFVLRQGEPRVRLYQCDEIKVISRSLAAREGLAV